MKFQLTTLRSLTILTEPSPLQYPLKSSIERKKKREEEEKKKRNTPPITGRLSSSHRIPTKVTRRTVQSHEALNTERMNFPLSVSDTVVRSELSLSVRRRRSILLVAELQSEHRSLRRPLVPPIDDDRK